MHSQLPASPRPTVSASSAFPRFHQAPELMPQPVLHNVTLCDSYQHPPLSNDANDDVHRLYPHLVNLTPIQTQALALLMQGHSDSAVARKLKITRMTVYRWKHHHPGFVAELNRARAELSSNASILFSRALRSSFKVIKKALKDPATPEARQVALAIINGGTARKALSADIGPTDPLSVVNDLAAREQRLVENTYSDASTHQEMSHRLARVNFTPEPADPPADSVPPVAN